MLNSTPAAGAASFRRARHVGAADVPLVRRGVAQSALRSGLQCPGRSAGSRARRVRRELRKQRDLVEIDAEAGHFRKLMRVRRGFNVVLVATTPRAKRFTELRGHQRPRRIWQQ